MTNEEQLKIENRVLAERIVVLEAQLENLRAKHHKLDMDLCDATNDAEQAFDAIRLVRLLAENEELKA